MVHLLHNTGFFLRICRELGAQVQGIEPSPHGAEITRRQRIPVFEGSLEDFIGLPGGYNVITSNHVIEHVPDPVATLKGLGSLLAPGGPMTIGVPNADSTFARALGREWHSTDLPFHLHQFSSNSLRVAAERAGLTVKSLSTVSLPEGSASSLRLLLRRRYGIPQRLSRWLPLGAKSMAKRHDAASEGEALIVRLAA